jgi:hypothetical protein
VGYKLDTFQSLTEASHRRMGFLGLAVKDATGLCNDPCIVLADDNTREVSMRDKKTLRNTIPKSAKTQRWTLNIYWYVGRPRRKLGRTNERIIGYSQILKGIVLTSGLD